MNAFLLRHRFLFISIDLGKAFRARGKSQIFHFTSSNVCSNLAHPKCLQKSAKKHANMLIRTYKKTLKSLEPLNV